MLTWASIGVTGYAPRLLIEQCKFMASTQIEGKQEVLWLHELMEPQAGLDTQDIKRE